MNVLLVVLGGVINVENSDPDAAPPFHVIVVCAPVFGMANNTSGVAGGAAAVVAPSKNNINPDDIPDGPIAPVAPVAPCVPVAPVAPLGPVGPAGPVAPTGIFLQHELLFKYEEYEL